MRHPRISVAQMKYFDIHRSNNLDKIKAFIRSAKSQGSDIICFPEICITKKEMLSFSHDYLKVIREECRKNSIWCIVSDEFKVGKKEYNLAVLIDRQGRIKGNYKKINLYYEDMDKGRHAHVFETDFGRVGIVICWDLAFPELFARLKDKGVQIVFCPALWWYEPGVHEDNPKESEKRLLESLLQARAFENLIYLALANPVRDQRYLIPYSAIVSPHRILKEIYGKEGLITADVNLKELGKYARLYPNKQL